MNIIHNISYTCNNNCKFCGIARNREKNPDLSTDEVKAKLTRAKKEGADELISPGGEPTVRPDMVDIVRFSKDIGFNHIEITTNGRMFAYRDFAKKITDAGLGYIRFSIHGHNSETHDTLTRTEGSFKEAIQGIRNIAKINRERKKYNNSPIYVEITSAISKMNYRHYDEMIDFFNTLDPVHIDTNYIIPWSAAHVYFKDIVPRFSDAVPYIKKGLDKNDKRKVKVTKVANIPVCFMTGYERYISEIFEKYIEIVNPTGEPFSYSGHRSEKKIQPKQCAKCRFMHICEGVYTQYIDRYGDSEFKPVRGELITEKNREEYLEKIKKGG